MKLMKVNRARKPETFNVFSDLMDEFFMPSFQGVRRHPIRKSVAQCNISENENEYKLEMAVPGMKKEDISIEVKDDVLYIVGNIQESKEEGKENFLKREFRAESFERSFHLNDEIDSDTIEASQKDGVLMISLPKKEENQTQSKAIEIA